MKASTGRIFWFVGLAVAAIAVAACFDVRVADWVWLSGWREWMKTSKVAAGLMKWPGNFTFTLALAVVAAMDVAWGHARDAGRWTWKLLSRPQAWGPGVLICLSGMGGGLLYTLIKWFVGRTRPFKMVGAFELHPFRGGFWGLIHAENQAFPSGHACLAFATAAAVAMVWRRGWWAVLALALMVGAQRVLEGAHYLSDVVGGAAVGAASAWLVVMGVKSLWERKRRES